MDKLNRQSLKAARPRLSLIDPKTSAFCWGFAVANMLLGLGVFFIYNESVVPLAIAGLISYKWWGTLFFTVGALTAYFLVINDWQLIRRMQLVALTLKSIWATALLFTVFTEHRAIIITIIWLLLAYFQATVYIYFLPIPKKMKGSSNGRAY